MLVGYQDRLERDDGFDNSWEPANDNWTIPLANYGLFIYDIKKIDPPLNDNEIKNI